MKRRTYLKTMLAGACSAGATAANKEHSIQLHVDLSVDPAKEQEMLQNFHTIFRPAASQQPGFIDLKMLKLRAMLAGAGPSGANYRFQLVFASEPQRQAWVATETHKRVWPMIEKTLTSTSYTIMLYEEA
jgi:heme-degrading monooxygenase HmoA